MKKISSVGKTPESIPLAPEPKEKGKLSYGVSTSLVLLLTWGGSDTMSPLMEHSSEKLSVNPPVFNKPGVI